MMNYDMGFNKEYLLTASIGVSTSERDAFSDELLKSPLIKDVAWAAGPLVNSTRMGWGRTFKGEQINIISSKGIYQSFLRLKQIFHQLF